MDIKGELAQKVSGALDMLNTDEPFHGEKRRVLVNALTEIQSTLFNQLDAASY
jgi:hypothetical protein